MKVRDPNECCWGTARYDLGPEGFVCRDLFAGFVCREAGVDAFQPKSGFLPVWPGRGREGGRLSEAGGDGQPHRERILKVGSDEAGSLLFVSEIAFPGHVDLTCHMLYCLSISSEFYELFMFSICV